MVVHCSVVGSSLVELPHIFSMIWCPSGPTASVVSQSITLLTIPLAVGLVWHHHRAISPIDFCASCEAPVSIQFGLQFRSALLREFHSRFQP